MEAEIQTQKRIHTGHINILPRYFLHERLPDISDYREVMTLKTTNKYMKIKLLAMLAALCITASCTKIERTRVTEEENLPGNVINSNENDTPTVEVYFHIKRVVKLHEKTYYDEYGIRHSVEEVDEITDRLYIRSVGSSYGYRALYDLEIYCENEPPLFLWNAETRTVSGLNKEIMWIDHCIDDYNDPIPTINVTRFFGQKISKTTTQSVVYNPLLNSWELCKKSI